MNLADKKKYSEELYMTGKYSQDKIAKMLDVSPQTMSKWSSEGGWFEIRARKQSLKKSISDRISILIDHQLAVMERAVENQQGEGELKALDKGQIDALSKLFAGIKQKELSFTQQIVFLTEFLDWAQKQNLMLAKQLAPLIDFFISQKRNDSD